MKLSLGPRQLVISLTPNAINGSKLAYDLRSRGAETDTDYAKLANRNQAKLERAQNELSGFFSGSRKGYSHQQQTNGMRRDVSHRGACRFLSSSPDDNREIDIRIRLDV
jgi:hypothetical protein